MITIAEKTIDFFWKDDDNSSSADADVKRIRAFIESNYELFNTQYKEDPKFKDMISEIGLTWPE